MTRPASGEPDPTALSWRALGGLVALAAVVRLALLPRVSVLQPDGCYYLWIAGDLGRRDWARALADSKPPLYPALIAAVHGLGLPLEAAGYAVSIALGALAAALLAMAFRRATGSAAAALAGAALYALQPEAVRAGADVMSEATFCFFVAAALATGLRALDTGELGAALASGALAGLAYLVRPEGLAVALAMGAPLLARARAAPRRITPLLALALGLLATAGPYALAISRMDGKLELSRKHTVAELTGLRAMPAMTPAADDLRAQVVGPPPAPHAGFGASVAALARAVWRAVSLLVDAAHPLVAALAVVGAISLRRRPGARRLAAAIAVFVGLGALLDWHMGYLDRRHLATAAALATGLAGEGAVALHRWLVALALVTHLRPRAVAASGLVIAAAILLPKALAPRFESHLGLREDGAWLRDYAGPGALVLGLYGTEVAYYAGGREVPVPYGSAADVVAAARARGVRFLVIGLRARGDDPPDPRPEATLGAIGLRPLVRLTHHGAGGRTVYRLVYELL